MFFELFDAFTPIDHLSPGWSAVVVFGLAPGMTALHFAAMRHREQEALGELARYEQPHDGLRLVEGVVVSDGEEASAATIVINERQIEKQGKTTRYTAWVETKSRTTARPFSLQGPDGTVTHVEPGDAPYVDRKATTEVQAPGSSDRTTRTRLHHLLPGARVFVYGRTLAPGGAEGYREPANTALVAPADRPLEVHAESPVPRLREEARQARRWQGFGLAGLAVIGAVVFSGYLAEVLLGRTLDATVTRVSTSRVRSGAHSSREVDVLCATPRVGAVGASTEEVCTTAERFDAAAFHEGDPVRVLVVDGLDDRRVGASGSLHEIAALVGLSALGVFLVGAARGPVAPWRTRPRR